MNPSSAFNCDTDLQQRFLALVKKHGIRTVIETGTYLGQTTVFLAQAVSKVVTIEASSLYFQQAGHLSEIPNVRRVLGSSSEVLPAVIRETERPRLYFLDAHWQHFNPLLAELEAIAASGEEPVILIHDFLVPGHPELGYDMYADGRPISLDLVLPLLQRIYKKPDLSFNDGNAAGAQRGVLIAEPGL